MYLKVIACEIMVREVCHVVADCPHIVDVDFLDQGYHDYVDTGRASIQARLDSLPKGKYDAVLLGYGLCNNLLAGLRANGTPLVVPKAHDCITIFLGSRERYDAEFAATPGTYYYTSGWLECRVRRGGDSMDQTSAHRTQVYESYVRKYGEDNAKYLMDMLHSWSEHYERGALISYPFDKVLELDRKVRAIAADRGWRFEELDGDLGLLRRWLSGDWDEDTFLLVQPGQTIKPAWNGHVLTAE